MKREIDRWGTDWYTSSSGLSTDGELLIGAEVLKLPQSTNLAACYDHHGEPVRLPDNLQSKLDKNPHQKVSVAVQAGRRSAARGLKGGKTS